MGEPNIAAIYALTEPEKAYVEVLVRSNVPPYWPAGYDTFVAGCAMAAACLPLNVLKWKSLVESKSCGLLCNLPFDHSLPFTPTVRRTNIRYPMYSDGIIGTISALFGSIYTIEGKWTGSHIDDVYPIFGDEATQLGSSKSKLEWHVEEAFHPARPTWLSLFCLRGDTAAITKIARARDLRLQRDVLSLLREPRFKLRIDETYSNVSSRYVITHILSGENSDTEIVFDPAYTDFRNDQEIQAFSALASAADEVHQPFTLAEGDLLIFNNRRTIHGRSAYGPRMDGADRWLKRAYILDEAEWIPRLKRGIMPFFLE